MHRFIPVLFLVACSPTVQQQPRGIVVPGRTRIQLKPEIRKILEQGSPLELLSLDPGLLPTSEEALAYWEEQGLDKLERVGGHHPVLGSMKLGEPGRIVVLNAFYDGIGQSDDSILLCFNPRHALRAKKGKKTVTVVICFECLSMMVYVNGEYAGRATTTAAPKRTFNSVLRKARGLPRGHSPARAR